MKELWGNWNEVVEQIREGIEEVELYMGRAEAAGERGEVLEAVRELAGGVKLWGAVEEWRGQLARLRVEEEESDMEMDRALAALGEGGQSGSTRSED